VGSRPLLVAQPGAPISHVMPVLPKAYTVRIICQQITRMLPNPTLALDVQRALTEPALRLPSTEEELICKDVVRYFGDLHPAASILRILQALLVLVGSSYT
jgi:hypothetical protein